MTEHSRGALGHGYTVVTPANHYPSRLPEFGDQPVVKLVTPRLAPSPCRRSIRVVRTARSGRPGARGSRPLRCSTHAPSRGYWLLSRRSVDASLYEGTSDSLA